MMMMLLIMLIIMAVAVGLIGSCQFLIRTTLRIAPNFIVVVAGHSLLGHALKSKFVPLFGKLGTDLAIS